MTIVIAGAVRGNLSADTRVEILPTGSLTGTVKSASFAADTGATVKGEVWLEHGRVLMERRRDRLDRVALGPDDRHRRRRRGGPAPAGFGGWLWYDAQQRRVQEPTRRWSRACSCQAPDAPAEAKITATATWSSGFSRYPSARAVPQAAYELGNLRFGLSSTRAPAPPTSSRCSAGPAEPCDAGAGLAGAHLEAERDFARAADAYGRCSRTSARAASCTRTHSSTRPGVRASRPQGRRCRGLPELLKDGPRPAAPRTSASDSPRSAPPRGKASHAGFRPGELSQARFRRCSVLPIRGIMSTS